MKQAIDSVKNTMFRSFLVAVFVLAVGIGELLGYRNPVQYPYIAFHTFGTVPRMVAVIL